MNTIEQRLKNAADMETRGVTAETLRPLELPASRRRLINWRVTGPLLVGAAVAVTAALAVWAAQVVRPADKQPLGSAVGGPPYFVGVDDRTGRATINDASTGRQVAEVGPAGRRYAAVAAADQRTFFLAAPGNGCASDVYRMRLASNGSVASLQRVTAKPLPTRAQKIAVTRDGTRLAITSVDWCKHGALIYDQRSGATHFWPADPSYPSAITPSWTADGRTLVLVPPVPPPSGTGKITYSYASAGEVKVRVLTGQMSPFNGTILDGIVSPDGRAITIAVQKDASGKQVFGKQVFGKPAVQGRRVPDVVLQRVPLVRDGDPDGTVAQMPNPAWNGFAADPTGARFLIRVGGDLVRLDGGHIRLVKRSSPWSSVAW